MDQLIGEFVIGARFNGPAGTGNGGYTAGLVAARLAAPAAAAPAGGTTPAGDTAPSAAADPAAGTVTTGATPARTVPARTVPAGTVPQVTLREPPPLDTPLRVTWTGDGVAVYAGARLVAEATPVPLADPPVPPVPYDQAVAASAGYPGFVDHPFPTCYVCGPRRAPGDGLRIFPGPLPGGRTAAPWQVPAGAGPETVWAALDCPGGWAIIGPGRPYVLGRMAAEVHAVPPAGGRCVVVGAVVATEGRKAHVRSAVYADEPDGPRLLGHARSTWIAVP